MSNKYWQGTPPTKCEGCQKPLAGVFSDMKTILGPWGNLCDSCVKSIGVGSYGLGLGQRYERQPDGRWLKTKG